MGTFEYVVRIDEKVGREKREGVEITFSFDVKDLPTSPSAADYNPAAGKKIKTDVPVFATNGVFAGLLNVSVTTKNKITAKIKGVSKKTLSFKGSWQEVFEGELVATLTTRTGEELELALKKNGNICAYLLHVTGNFGSELSSTDWGVAACPELEDYAKYLSRTTVTAETGETFTVKVNKKGKVSYKGTTAAGVSIRGTAQILLNAYEDHAAQLCLVKTTGRNPYAYVIKLD